VTQVEKIKYLRELTGAGMSDIKAALVLSGGVVDAAEKILRAQGTTHSLTRLELEAKLHLLTIRIESLEHEVTRLNSLVEGPS